MPTMNPRITFTVSEETMNAIDEYRFSHRLKNQTQAILSLIDLGFRVLQDKEPFKPVEKLSDEDKRVLNAYHAALPVIQSAALQMLENNPSEKKASLA